MPQPIDERKLRWVRPGLLVVAGAALAICVITAWEFYAGPAPFHQFYRSATETQNADVTSRLIATIAGIPLAVTGLTAALAGRDLWHHPRHWLFVLACIWLLAAVQGFAVRLLLPYGFASGYEHTSRSQIAHLQISGTIGACSFILAVATLIASACAGRTRHRLQPDE